MKIIEVGPLPPDLHIDTTLTIRWLVAFLRDEILRRRGMSHVVLGLSGGVDSAVVAALCARAFGPEAVTAFRLPYRLSSPTSLTDAEAVAQCLGIACQTIDITPSVDGYLQIDPNASARRRGNVMARTRMLILFDQAMRLNGIPIGTGNKTERLMGYFTWHADDAPPVNPIGDLWKTQVWELARALEIPSQVIAKPPSADLEANQTDEQDLGISYERADRILAQMLEGFSDEAIITRGSRCEDVTLVRQRVDATHWKRHLPTTAMVSGTAINEFYLRPVDY